jgi:hypothetical protein
MKELWYTRWEGTSIVVYRNEVEVDRIEAASIERVLLRYRRAGDYPGDVVQAVVELADELVILGAETGFAGRVNFERQAFWAARHCVHWVSEARAPLPLNLRTSFGFWHLTPPAWARVPRSQLVPFLARWPIQGAQTWDERKQRRIVRAQPLSFEQA